MELNKIINDDCMNIITKVPDKFFDLAIVDPPYGIGADKFFKNFKGYRKSKNCSYKNFTEKNWDNCIPDQKYFTELFRISKNQIIWGGNYFIEYLKNTSCFIILDKKNRGTSFADAELAWTSFKTRVRTFSYSMNNLYAKENKIHPTQKPIALYRWILQNYAKENDKIIDTHSGSGSLAIACLLENFDFLAIEKDKHYYQKSVKRLEEEKKQLKLF